MTRRAGFKTVAAHAWGATRALSSRMMEAFLTGGVVRLGGVEDAHGTRSALGSVGSFSPPRAACAPRRVRPWVIVVAIGALAGMAVVLVWATATVAGATSGGATYLSVGDPDVGLSAAPRAEVGSLHVTFDWEAATTLANCGDVSVIDADTSDVLATAPYGDGQVVADVALSEGTSDDGPYLHVYATTTDGGACSDHTATTAVYYSPAPATTTTTAAPEATLGDVRASVDSVGDRVELGLGLLVFVGAVGLVVGWARR